MLWSTPTVSSIRAKVLVLVHPAGLGASTSGEFRALPNRAEPGPAENLNQTRHVLGLVESPNESRSQWQRAERIPTGLFRNLSTLPRGAAHHVRGYAGDILAYLGTSGALRARH